MSLTSHQSQILQEALDILEKEDRLVIEGSAGVGKTYLVNYLIQELLKKSFLNNSKVYCSAPTNKAVAVLKNKIEKHSKIELITTHSALKLKRIIDYNTGEVSFKPSYSKNPPLEGVGLLIIDEASMLNLSLLIDVEIHARKNNCKVIFIGDNKQLNPVGEIKSPVFLGQPIKIKKENHNITDFPFIFNDSYDNDFVIVFKPYPIVSLTEIIRQKEGNPIIDLSRNLSEIKSFVPKKTEEGGYIFTSDASKVISTLAHVNGTDDLKYLAYTNAEVDRVNKLVRQAIYGNPKKIEIGETLVFNAPYGENYFTNEELKVKECIVREQSFSYMVNSHAGIKAPDIESSILKYYSINPMEIEKPIYNSEVQWAAESFEKVLTDNVIVIHEDSEKEFKRILKVLKDAAKPGMIPWEEYYRFYEQFADMKYNHAITVHKSQGSTYKQAIVNVKNIDFCRELEERQRLLYTAVTRASDLLILYNN